MNQGQGISSTLTPALAGEVVNPQGFASQDMNAMNAAVNAGANAANTASQQSLGGANASAAGQGALTEARTRNAGALNPAIEESARNAMRQGSQNALGVEQNREQNLLDIQKANAFLRNANQQGGLSGLQGLYGTNVNAANQALGLSNQAIGEWNQAGRNTTDAALGWTKAITNMFKPVAIPGTGG